ncbi:GNAT family N-acetyltransferase [Streptacidiphilus sp. MAP5-52]|uniref:GNAT family N-acetyltransferase n=1 Tax=Streptacidiphilus sp. MAP5-52 TaxID=3156267 RepID=UPI003512EAA3
MTGPLYTWFRDTRDLPPVAQADQPFHTAAWAHAWERACPEQVLSHHHLVVQDEGTRHYAPFHLTASSPFWARMEHDAAMSVPWPGPLLFAGSLYAEYGGAATGSDAALAAVLGAGLDLARELGAAALVVPNLTAPLAARAQRARPADATVFTDLAFSASAAGGIEGHAARAGNRRVMRDLLRQHRRGTDAGLRFKALHGADMLPHLDRFAQLAGAGAERHGTALYRADMFPYLSAVPGAVMLAAFHEDQLVGAFLGFVHKDRVHLWTAGVDRERQRELRTYTWLIAEALNWADASSIAVVDIGRGNASWKTRHGFTAAELHTHVHLTGPAPQFTTDAEELGARIRNFATTGAPGPHAAASQDSPHPLPKPKITDAPAGTRCLGRRSKGRPLAIDRSHNGLVTARSPLHWRGRHSHHSEVLQLIGFVPVHLDRTTVLVLPSHLPQVEQRRKAATAAATLHRWRHVHIAEDLNDPQATPHWEEWTQWRPGDRTALDQATHSDEAARILLRLSAPETGSLADAAYLLEEVRKWWLCGPASWEQELALRQVRDLAGRLRAIAGEISWLRTDLALMNRDLSAAGTDTVAAPQAPVSDR